MLNEEVRWITFHSGYDFGYLLKLVTCRPLPAAEDEFNELLRLYFPIAYDMKYCMKFCDSLHGGLQKLAEVLDVERIGPQHQAGSDSLLTACTFFKLKKSFFAPEAHIGPIDKYKNILYGERTRTARGGRRWAPLLLRCGVCSLIASPRPPLAARRARGGPRRAPGPQQQQRKLGAALAGVSERARRSRASSRGSARGVGRDSVLSLFH